MLQQLQNLANDDTLHGYQTFPLLGAWTDNVLFAESRVEDCLELKFRYVDYQPCACKKSELLLNPLGADVKIKFLSTYAEAVLESPDFYKG